MKFIFKSWYLRSLLHLRKLDKTVHSRVRTHAHAPLLYNQALIYDATGATYRNLPCQFAGILNKTGTSKVGAKSKAQKAQSFLNMPRMYS